MSRFFHLLLFAGLLALTACGPDYEYEVQLPVPKTGWTYQDSLVASFEVPDTTVIYNLHLLLEHTTIFPNQNFYVRVHTTFPDGQRLTEQVSLEIAGKGGLWLGDCSGEVCTLDIPLQEGAYFNQAGAYVVSVEQYSRRDPLPGITSVGFALEATADKR